MRRLQWTWLPLLACAAAAPRVGAQEEPPGDPGWRLPPLQVSGSLAYELRASRGRDEPTSVSHLVTANVGLRTYVWQPWFATLTGSLALTDDWTRLGSEQNGTASLHERIRAREQFATGSGRVDLFPQSRFPFEAHVERSDSRVDSGLASSIDFRTSNLGFSQRYRPPSGPWNVLASYDHRTQSGLGFAARQDALAGEFGTRWKANELDLGASYSRARSDSGGDDSRFTTFTARHQYAPGSALSVNTTANWTRTEERALPSPSDLKALQLTSVGLWHRDDSPLTLTGSGRYLALREGRAGNEVDSTGVLLGANYEFSPNLRLTGSAGANTTRSNGRGANAFTGTAGASYQGDTRSFLGLRYDWFASGSAGAALDTSPDRPDQRQTTLNLQLGHSVARNWAMGEQAMLTVNATQSLAWTSVRQSPQVDLPGLASSRILLNTVSATWQAGGGERNAYARASYSDSLELGRENRFQLFNFQLSGNFDIDVRRSVSGDLTFQRTQQRIAPLSLAGEPAAPGRASSRGASGEVSYRHQRPFGIARLRFVSRLKLAQDVLKQPGTLPSLPDRETRLWENRLDYSIGRLDTQLLLRLSEVDGRRRESLMFRVQRSFGD